MSQRVPIEPSYEKLVESYQNTEAHNDYLFEMMTSLTFADLRLRSHRAYVEAEKRGYGDAAHHAMWLRLLDAGARRFGEVRALEIGVYKGQIISLWSLIGREWGMKVDISAITPLAGNPLPSSRLVRWLRYRASPKFREEIVNGNFYDDQDYLLQIRALFAQFTLDFDEVRLCRGRSDQAAVLKQFENRSFHIIYVDGDHTYEAVRRDFANFGPKIEPGGWLVADDAGCDLPGTKFWKGHESVSRAARELSGLGFRNVLNVGHNRVFERLSA